MAHTTSQLNTKLSTEAINNEGEPWNTPEAAVELILTAVSGVTLGASNAAADPGSDATKAIAVQGVTAGKAVAVSGPLTDTQLRASAVPTTVSAGTAHIGEVASQTKQYTGTPSSYSIQTADQTVFTLAAGEVGFLQNLSADAPLAVKLGATASTTSLNFILPKTTSASDGTSAPVRIDYWIGAVSVAKMTGTASYLAWKQAA